jgi:hypothetical protein
MSAALSHVNWSVDPDWWAVAVSPAHAQHHIGIDSYGNYFCRECSTRGIYLLRQDEVDRLCVIERAKAEGQR